MHSLAISVFDDFDRAIYTLTFSGAKISPISDDFSEPREAGLALHTLVGDVLGLTHLNEVHLFIKASASFVRLYQNISTAVDLLGMQLEGFHHSGSTSLDLAGHEFYNGGLVLVGVVEYLVEKNYM